MSTNTSDQGLIIPTNTDVNNFATGVGSLIGANPTTGVSGTGGVESRLVKRYLSAADRAARNPTPAEGELAYLMDINTIEVYTGTTWTWPYAKGLIGGTRFTTGTNLAAGVGSTELVLNMSSGTLSLDASRAYRINARIKVIMTNTGGTAIFHIRENSISGTIRGEFVYNVGSVSFGYQPEWTGRYDTTSAETKAFILTGSVNTGSFTVSAGSTNIPTYIEVEDIGPTGKMTIQ